MLSFLGVILKKYFLVIVTFKFLEILNSIIHFQVYCILFKGDDKLF